ncbi:hypothetical protein BKI52_20005 [marine bacterium AO1-C]|nr:hypothetical protein BKI52_20005 [marine bacterium AO1-C]
MKKTYSTALLKVTCLLALVFLEFNGLCQSKYGVNYWQSNTKNTQATSIVFSPDGQQMVVGYSNGQLKLWEVNSGKLIKRYPKQNAPIQCMAYSPNGDKILLGLEEFAGAINVKLLKARSGKLLNAFNGGSEGINFVGFSPDGNQMIIGNPGDGKLGIWNLLDKKPIETFSASLYPNPIAAVFLAGNKVLFRRNSAIIFKNLQAKSNYRKITYPTLNKTFSEVTNFSLSPDQKNILIGNEDHPVKLWRIKDKKLMHTFGTNQKESIGIFSPSGKSIVTYDNSQQLKIWKAKKQKLITSIEMKSKPTQVEFSPDGQYLFTMHQFAEIRVAKTGKLKHNFGQNKDIKQAWFSPDSQSIATRDNTGKISLWDAKTGKLIRKF